MILAYIICSVLLAAGVALSRREGLMKILCVAFYAMQLAFGVWAAWNFQIGARSTIFAMDRIAVFFFCIMALIAPVVFRYSLWYLDEETPAQKRTYHALLILLCMAIGCVYFSNNAAVTWIFLEMTTLCTAGLIYHRRTQRSLEATWKYIFVCSVGISIAYLGILLLGSMASHGDMSYGGLAKVIADANPLFLKISFLFIMVGYSCKMEVFPLYTIGVDANHAAPAPASALISTGLVNAGFMAIYRVYMLMRRTEIMEWMSYVLIIAGSLSLIIGALYLRRTRHYKRFLAYSTVENMGIVLIGLGVGGVGIVAAIFHMAAHSLIKSALFLQMSQVGKIYNSYQIDRIGNYMTVSRAGGALAIITALLLLAFPPSPLFVSELMIFKQIVVNKQWWLLALMVALICLVMYTFGRNIVKLCYQPVKKGTEPGKVRLDLTFVLPVVALLTAAIVFGIWQPVWMRAWFISINHAMGV